MTTERIIHSVETRPAEKMSCGCEFLSFYRPRLLLCPMHAEAPELLAIVEEVHAGCKPGKDRVEQALCRAKKEP